MTSIFLFRPMYNKTIIRFDFCDIQNNQGLGKSYQPQASAKYPYLDPSLIILDITNTSSNSCLWPDLRKVGPRTNSWDSWGFSAYLTWVWWPNGEKTCVDLRANLISSKVSANHLNSMRAGPGQTESQVYPSFQLGYTCESVWPGLKRFDCRVKKDSFPSISTNIV